MTTLDCVPGPVSQGSSRFSLRNKRDKFDKCSVVISLTQIMEHRKEEKSIGFRVYKLTEEQKRESPLGAKFIDNALNVVKTSGAYINLREARKHLYKQSYNQHDISK